MAKRKTGRPKKLVATVQVSTVVPVLAQAKIRRLAAAEGITLGAWIRRLVIRALALAV